VYLLSRVIDGIVNCNRSPDCLATSKVLSLEVIAQIGSDDGLFYDFLDYR
jgi:hypothetical protein